MTPKDQVMDAEGRPRTARRVCVVGASGTVGQHLIEHALDRGYEVVAVCRERSVAKLAWLADRITVVPGDTDDADVVGEAVQGCDAVLTVLVPWGVRQYSSGTAQAVLDRAEPSARLVFSCGWCVSMDGRDRYTRRFRTAVRVTSVLARATRVAELDDQAEACRRIFGSGRAWTVVRGSRLEDGESQGLPVWSSHVGDPVLASNLTRRVDFALFMVEALADDSLIHRAPAVVGRLMPSALAYGDPDQPYAEGA